MKNICPLYSAEKRLDDCLKLWKTAKYNYFKPNSFILNLNNLIQSLRSVTFILQKNKNPLPNFENWYQEWQEVMKKDDILVWLKKARNYIEKEGDLETLSKVRLSIINSYFEPPIFETVISPFIRTEEFLRIITKIKPKEINLEKGFLRAERLWVDSQLESRELIEANAHVFIFLLNLIIDAHDKLLNSDFNCQWYSRKLISMQETINMLDQKWERTIWTDLSTKEITEPAFKKIELDNDILEKAKKRYGNLDDFKQELNNAKNLKEQASILFKSAKLLLSKDGTHISMVYLGYANGELVPFPYFFTKREEKYMFFRMFASIVKDTFAISIIAINECWIASAVDKIKQFIFPSDDPNRKEGLHLVAANSSGEIISFFVQFNRNKNGKIILGKEFIIDDDMKDRNIFLEPVFEVWKKNNSFIVGCVY